MSRPLFYCGVLFATLLHTGCVGWGPCGDEQFRGPFRGALEGMASTCGDHCGNCDGYYRPPGSIRQALACGSGCGEIYYGEWVSNPPNTCNECDARGFAYGANGRYPWLSGLWAPWGVKYRPDGGGYGNPYRATHPGLADYGGYRPGLWGRYRFAADCGSCGTGMSPGCATGNCAPNAPVGEHLMPIPDDASAQGYLPAPTRSHRVNYESPLLRGARGTSTTRTASGAASAAGSPNSGSRSTHRASLKVVPGESNDGRLKQRSPLR